MSAEVVVKKRGRPKKVTETDSIVVINTTPDSVEIPLTKTKKPRVAKTTKAEAVIKPTIKSRVTRKAKVDGPEVEGELLLTTQAKRSAKNVQNATPNQPDVNTSTTENMQPIAKEIITYEVEVAKSPNPSSVAADSVKIDVQKPQIKSEILVTDDLIINAVENEHTADHHSVKHDQGSTYITQAGRSTPIDLQGDSNTTLPASDLVSPNSDSSLSITRLESTLLESEIILDEAAIELDVYKQAFEQRLLIETWSAKLEQLAQESLTTSKIIQEIIARRATAETKAAFAQSKIPPSHLVTPTKTLEENQLAFDEAEVQTLHIRSELDHLLQSKLTIKSPSPTMSNPQSSPPPQPSSSSSPHIKQPSQPQILTTTTTKPSTLIKPRQSSASPTTPPRAPGSVPPMSFPLPNQSRPTEQSLAELKRNPEFKRLSRSWTGLIVGIPVLIATSVVLYKNYQTKQMERSLGLGDFSSNNELGFRQQHIGVDSKKVGSAVNGGV